MGIVSIEDAKLGHAIFLAKVGRAEVLDLAAGGLDPRVPMAVAFRRSGYRRVMLVDGIPVAIIGVHESLLSDDKYVWVHISPQARTHMKAFAIAARQEYAKLTAGACRIVADVDKEDAVACRFVERFGLWPEGSRGRAVRYVLDLRGRGALH
jgi:hypothetical protein